MGTVTSVVGYEGLETMIRALPLLPDHVSFLVVGDGTDKRRLEAIAAELNLESRVSFVGRKPQDEIVPWYRSLDAFVVPRIDSPVCRAVTPIKPLAAMALGIPVIASDLPALREVTGGCAKYVEPENPTALAEGIRAVTEGKYESTRARAWAEARTWDRVGNVLREFYQEIEKKGTR
ncbi:glycosyltransferase [Corynebacterium hadale]|uniref:glycosyltransferase n=1 Tax=Corynebacterium hadale TaxID=2026255 RepID=UPI003C306126